MTRRPIDYKALRDLIRPETVLWPTGWRPIRRAGRNEVGPCPLCGGGQASSGCLLVGSRVVKCLRCGFFGDALELFCQIHHWQPYEGAKALCGDLRIDVPYIDRPRPPALPTQKPSAGSVNPALGFCVDKPT